MSSTITLYGYWRSSASWRVRIGLEYKKLPYEYVPVHLNRGGGEQRQAAHRLRNPMQQVPVLELVEKDRTVRLIQSMAILEYLEERWPAPPLLPVDSAARAASRALAELVNSGIQPLQNLTVLEQLKRAGADEKDWARHFIGRGLEALEMLAAQTAGRFLVGDEVSIADVCLVPQLYNARRFDVDLDAYSTLRRVEENCSKLDAFARAHANRQPDAQHGS